MRLVQVGLGGFGKSWAELAHAAAGVDLVAVADAAPAARAWAVTALGLPAATVFATLANALVETEADAVLIATTPETHHALVTEALQAGKHVLTEKPLATTLADGRDMVATAARHNRLLMVSQNYRFRRPARAAQQVIASGGLGKLVSVTIRCRLDTRTFWPPENFRYHMEHPYLLDMSIHSFDLLRAVTGQEVNRVFAREWRVPDSPFRDKPALMAILDLADGATATYEGNWAAHDHFTSANGEWEIVGEAGRLHWTGGEGDWLTGVVTVQRWGQPPRPVEQPHLAHIDRAGALEAFRLAVESGAEPETSGRDNLRSLAIVLACLESVERSTAVEVASV